MLSNYKFMRHLSNGCGHKFIDTSDLCTSEIQDILWTSLDLKARVKNHSFGKPLEGSRITMLCSCQSRSDNLLVQSALQTLGADVLFMLSSRWEQYKFKKDVGKFCSLYSDLVVAGGRNHNSLCQLTEGASVPVVNIASHKFAPLHALGVLMTLQEHFGRLNGLTLGWVGPMGKKLNTFIYLLPKVGIHLKYNSSPTPNFPASPLVLPAGKNFCKTFNTRIEACPDPLSTIAGVDVIGTSKHKKETQKLELHMFEGANKNWIFFHILPRWEGEVSEDVFNHQNSLVWTLHENIKYTLMAVVLRLLKTYRPTLVKPNFN
ncbi:ornithine carbamoyltransferase, mitochondrial-like isoform X1 [Homalodisca vitripennis]|uniref:ornithine carbamoyltransferase, mitochondrial-like isoform X1 n=2 Tax=Homalodisca vitripennis TaxID=197043 RepID=UPI001EEBDCF7|nr:ornithine carbamoyltransferase, mitochondrial-like isoform X1 [Homalodisca vitripennis]